MFLPLSAAALFSLENPIIPWVPSQNGLFFDAPHLHKATPRMVESGLLSSEDIQQF